MATFEDCANQRPLTDKGRDEAVARIKLGDWEALQP